MDGRVGAFTESCGGLVDEHCEMKFRMDVTMRTNVQLSGVHARLGSQKAMLQLNCNLGLVVNVLLY